MVRLQYHTTLPQQIRGQIIRGCAACKPKPSPRCRTRFSEVHRCFSVWVCTVEWGFLTKIDILQLRRATAYHACLPVMLRHTRKHCFPYASAMQLWAGQMTVSVQDEVRNTMVQRKQTSNRGSCLGPRGWRPPIYPIYTASGSQAHTSCLLCFAQNDFS